MSSPALLTSACLCCDKNAECHISMSWLNNNNNQQMDAGSSIIATNNEHPKCHLLAL